VQKATASIAADNVSRKVMTFMIRPVRLPHGMSGVCFP
jgi:hypothetical protein